MPDILWLDTETFNPKPISHGTYAYAETCEAMVLTYAINDAKVVAVDLTEDPVAPREFADALFDPGVLLKAHNAMFDRNVLKFAMGAETDITRWRCTMVQALAHGLPGSLGTLCEVFRVGDDHAKLKEGNKLIHLFCKPRPKNATIRRATVYTHPDEWYRFIDYAIRDTEAMRAVSKKMPDWNYKGDELDLWHFDQKVNDRGFCVDLDLANAALEAVRVEQLALKKQTQENTGYDPETGEGVASSTQRDAMLQHIVESYGVMLPDMKKDTIERRVADPDLPEPLRELLNIRLQASASSTSKYKALLRGTTRGRLRGTIQYDGASRTRRAAGRTFQPQNIPRPAYKAAEVEFGIALMKAGCADLILPNVMAMASASIRGCIVAPEGKKLVVSDLANIEGRVLAYLAGEAWKLQAFRDYDAGIGEDLYRLAYAKAFKIDVTQVTDFNRQVGKTKELMLGYGGGVGAYLTGAATYRIDLDEMSTLAYPAIPPVVWNEAKKFWHWSIKTRRSTYGLTEFTFCVCDSLKRMWRLTNPMIVKLWAAVEENARMAIANPAIEFVYRDLIFKRDGTWLRIILPSGNCLCYPGIKLEEDGKITFMGNNQYTRKWERAHTYAGKLVENIVQSLSRDVLYHGMRPAEAAGYQLVMSVHDELITEAPDSPDYGEGELSSILATVPPWVKGLPLSAAGFEAYRYRKG